MKTCLLVLSVWFLCSGNLAAEKMNPSSVASFIQSIQAHVGENPSAFPLESQQGGQQSLRDGLRDAYFGYGERRYSHRFDFHPAMDVGYFPTEVGRVTDEQGEVWEVRSPQSYLKKVYAIQKGELVSIALISTGYKIVLKHTLETPYFDNEGRAYQHYYTCYRHLDSRSLSYLSGLAKEFTNDPEANYEALFGKYVFEAGEQMAYVGFTPDKNSVGLPRAHLDFSLNLYADPNRGNNIRNYALNPLLLFPPFEYMEPASYDMAANNLPAYQFVVDETSVVTPGDSNHAGFRLQVKSGGLDEKGVYQANRYYALNGLDIELVNAGKSLGTYRVDRHSKQGYQTESYDLLDNPNPLIPHFLAPLGEQGDAFEMGVVLPMDWFEAQQYDWSKEGSLVIGIHSIWAGYLDGHSHKLTIPLQPVEPNP